LWEIDGDGKVLNEPEHTFSHSMDALRYGLASMLKTATYVTPEATKPSLPWYPEIGV